MSSKNTFSENDIVNNMYKAVYSGNLEKANEIIDSYGLLPWEEGKVLIGLAITTKRLEIAKVLIKKGCKFGDTIAPSMPLYPDAVCCGDVELIGLLLDKDPESLNKTQHGNALVHLAVSQNAESLVKLLLERGADINFPDSDGMFPLHLAAKRGNVKILKLLLNAGAYIESYSCPYGRSSLFYAIESGNICVVKLLLKNGANCNAKSLKGKTVLHYAIETRASAIAKELVEAGADLNQRNNVAQTPLHVACMLNDRYLISVLLTAGADVNATDCNGMVPCDAFEKKVISSSVFIDSAVSFLMVKQLLVLKEGGLFLHNKNKTFLDIVLKTYCVEISMGDEVVSSPSEIIKSTMILCQHQICLMKKMKIDRGFTFYDILKKLNDPLNTATETEINVLQSAILENNFPLYKVILKNQLKYAKLRNSLLTQAQEYFSSLILLSKSILPPLPEEMRTYVVSYLNNYELDLLLENIEKPDNAKLKNWHRHKRTLDS